MEWVEGQTLNRFVEESLEKPKMLRQLLELWPRLAVRLREAGIAHADLQHGNVLLVPAPHGKLALKLIDYDGMYVPSLAGTQSGELGHPNYQHPQRIRQGRLQRGSGPLLPPGHLRRGAMSAAGRRDLWQRFNNDDNLLFREADFQRPEESELFQTLWELKDADARTMVGHLALACRQPLEAVPWLDQIVSRGRVRALTRTEQEAVSSLMAAGKALARLKIPVGAVATASTAALPATAPEQTAAVDTRPVATEGTMPAAPLLGNRLRAVGRSLLGLPAATFHAADRLFGRLVGEENDLLRQFLWVAVPAALLFVVWLAACHPWRQPLPAAEKLAAGHEAAVEHKSTAKPKPAAVKQEPKPGEPKPGLAKQTPAPAPLKLQAVGPQRVEIGGPLTLPLALKDAAVWKGKVHFTLGPDAPPGATIDAERGVFTWTPTAD